MHVTRRSLAALTAFAAGVAMVAATATATATPPVQAAAPADDFTSILTDGALVGAGWAKCPTAIIWDADVSGLSPRAQKFALEDLEWAFGIWGAAAGIPVTKGAEAALSYDNGSAMVSGGGGGRKMFVKFVKDAESDYLSGRVVGVASPTRVIPQAPEITGGSAAFRVDYVEHASKSESRALLLHELGHALGLGHSKDKKSVMYPIVGKTLTLAKGDLAGIRAFTKDCNPAFGDQRG